jgi:hypothetical protein
MGALALPTGAGSDRQGFLRYFDNHDGFALPPAWTAPDDRDSQPMGQ